MLSFCFFAGSCGFKPVHAKTENNYQNQLVTELSSVQIADISGREGQLLKYKLADLLNPDSATSYPKYKLEISLSSSTENLGIQENLRVTRYNVSLTADYKLIALENNQIIDQGKTKVKSSYNRTSSEFSTFVADEDSSEKAAEELAQILKQHLTAHFTK